MKGKCNLESKNKKQQKNKMKLASSVRRKNSFGWNWAVEIGKKTERKKTHAHIH